MILPPGTILQLLYLKERLQAIHPGVFIEVGVGQGYLSSLLLERGWRGIGFELDEESAASARAANESAVSECRYEVREADWLRSEDVPEDEPSSLIKYRYEDPAFEQVEDAAARDVAAVEEDAKYFGPDSPASQDEL